MRNNMVIIVLAVLLLVAGFGDVTMEGEGAYNIAYFEDLGDLGAWPCLYDDEIIFIRGLKQDNKSTIGIWIKNDTSDMQLLYANDSIGYTFSGPKFSPNGAKIVFLCKGVSVLEKNENDWNENVSANWLNVTGGYPSFSSDGTKIVLGRNEPMEGGKGDIWIMDIDGSNKTQLSFNKKGSFHPAFSPDGKRIVYLVYSKNGEHEMWIMNSDGTERKRILSDSWYPDHPTFMPDGKILFASARVSPHSNKVGAPSIWMMEQDGSNRTLLAPSVITSLGSERPTINRNGTRIAFEHGLGGSFSIYVVEDPDGDGEWEDSDGNHVADICDGYPDDPDRGYITGDDDDGGFLPGFRGEVMVVAVTVAVISLKKKKQ